MATQGEQVFMCLIRGNTHLWIFSGINFLLFRIQDGVCDPPHTDAEKDPDQTDDDKDLNMKKVHKRSRVVIQNISSVMKVNHAAVAAAVVVVTWSPGGVM